MSMPRESLTFSQLWLGTRSRYVFFLRNSFVSYLSERPPFRKIPDPQGQLLVYPANHNHVPPVYLSPEDLHPHAEQALGLYAVEILDSEI